MNVVLSVSFMYTLSKFILVAIAILCVNSGCKELLNERYLYIYIYTVFLILSNPLTLILTGYEYYIFLTGCKPDMCHTFMILLPGPLIFLEN